MADMIDKALDARLTDRAREAWHPVSEPPTEADADDHGMVVWRDRHDGRAEMSKWWLVRDEPDLFIGCEWARIRDVVLFPPGRESQDA